MSIDMLEEPNHFTFDTDICRKSNGAPAGRGNVCNDRFGCHVVLQIG
jgi:hypothetical protein